MEYKSLSSTYTFSISISFPRALLRNSTLLWASSSLRIKYAFWIGFSYPFMLSRIISFRLLVGIMWTYFTVKWNIFKLNYFTWERCKWVESVELYDLTGCFWLRIERMPLVRRLIAIMCLCVSMWMWER